MVHSGPWFPEISNAKCCFVPGKKSLEAGTILEKKGALSEILLMEEIRLTS